jgi:Icc-related predicted phosphoesterase
MTKIFFCTDIHGSSKCWRKVVSAGDFYRVDHVVLGGDLTGKAVIPLIRQNDGTCTSNFLGRKWTLKDQKEVEDHKKLIVDAGLYFYEGNPDDLEELKNKKEKVDQIFREKVIERVKNWMEIADTNLKAKKRKIIVCPGNDDHDFIDPILKESDVILDAEGKVLDLNGHHEMLNSGWSNPTPWNTPRECSEEDLSKRIEAMSSQVKVLERSIFNLHAPPFDSGLDTGPKLKEDFKVSGGETEPVGSKAVSDAVRKYQPLLGLHGHIHEGLGNVRLAEPGVSTQAVTTLRVFSTVS